MNNQPINNLINNNASQFLSSELIEKLKSKVFKPILHKRSVLSPIRIWVNECSTGLAAYAVSICLLELFEEMSLNIPIKIFATDKNEEAIVYARAGVYSESILSCFSTQRQQCFFRKISGGYKIIEKARNCCIFGKHNLIQDPYLLHLDLIVCCRSPEGLDTDLEKKLLFKFHQAIDHLGFIMFLAPNGKDVPPELFKLVDEQYRIFVKGSAPTENNETASLEYFQSIIEEYRIKYQSLQEFNEDTICLQEELRVTNEEMQVKNEELIILIQDLEQRNIELAEAKTAAEDASRSKDQFLAVISHELRTPLTAILGWVRLIQGGRADKNDFNRAIEVIERNARIQKRLIEDLLDLSVIISGKLSLNIEPVEIRLVVWDVINTLHPTADAKGIKIKTEMEAKTQPFYGDTTRLQQIISNLLNNAIKFSSEGDEIKVKLEQSESKVEITISDSGKGISPGLLPYIFDPFRQGDGSITRNHGGLGLGLTIAYRLVEAHGGSLQAESDGDGQGATFKVILPVMDK